MLGKAQPIKRMTRGPEARSVLKITVHGREVLATGEHPFDTGGH